MGPAQVQVPAGHTGTGAVALVNIIQCYWHGAGAVGLYCASTAYINTCMYHAVLQVQCAVKRVKIKIQALRIVPVTGIIQYYTQHRHRAVNSKY